MWSSVQTGIDNAVGNVNKVFGWYGFTNQGVALNFNFEPRQFSEFGMGMQNASTMPSTASGISQPLWNSALNNGPGDPTIINPMTYKILTEYFVDVIQLETVEVYMKKGKNLIKENEKALTTTGVVLDGFGEGAGNVLKNRAKYSSVDDLVRMGREITVRTTTGVGIRTNAKTLNLVSKWGGRIGVAGNIYSAYQVYNDWSDGNIYSAGLRAGVNLGIYGTSIVCLPCGITLGTLEAIYGDQMYGAFQEYMTNYYNNN